jgi:hypothetical protein
MRIHGLPAPRIGAHLVQAALRFPAQLGFSPAWVSVTYWQVAGPAGDNPVWDGLATCPFISLNYFQDAVALSGTQVVDQFPRAISQLF